MVPLSFFSPHSRFFFFFFTVLFGASFFFKKFVVNFVEKMSCQGVFSI